MSAMSAFLDRWKNPGTEVVIGHQEFSSPRLRIADPLDLHDAPPICFETPIGKFPVKAFQKPWGPEPGYPYEIANAFLVVDFTATKAVDWKHIVPFGKAEGEAHEFSAEFGSMSVFDNEVFQRLNAIDEETGGNLYDQFLAERIDESDLCWFVKLDDEVRGKNIALCFSGRGNGMYPAFMGTDDLGEPARIVIDLEVG